MDEIRKMTGKLIKWKPDETNNLHELWHNLVVPMVQQQGSATAAPSDSKQIFYTCLQIFVQASGAYCELVEPALITGNDERKESLVLRTSFYFCYMNFYFLDTVHLINRYVVGCWYDVIGKVV